MSALVMKEVVVPTRLDQLGNDNSDGPAFILMFQSDHMIDDGLNNEAVGDIRKTKLASRIPLRLTTLSRTRITRDRFRVYG